MQAENDLLVDQIRKLMAYCRVGGHQIFPLEVRKNPDSSFEIQSNYRSTRDTITCFVSAQGEYINFRMIADVETLE